MRLRQRATRRSWRHRQWPGPLLRPGRRDATTGRCCATRQVRRSGNYAHRPGTRRRHVAPRGSPPRSRCCLPRLCRRCSRFRLRRLRLQHRVLRFQHRVLRFRHRVLRFHVRCLRRWRGRARSGRWIAGTRRSAVCLPRFGDGRDSVARRSEPRQGILTQSRTRDFSKVCENFREVGENFREVGGNFVEVSERRDIASGLAYRGANRPVQRVADWQQSRRAWHRSPIRAAARRDRSGAVAGESGSTGERAAITSGAYGVVGEPRGCVVGAHGQAPDGNVAVAGAAAPPPRVAARRYSRATRRVSSPIGAPRRDAGRGPRRTSSPAVAMLSPNAPE